MQIGLVGSGNVATRLGLALMKTKFPVSFVYSKSYSSALRLANRLKCKAIDSTTDLNKTDLIIIAINDDAIATVLDGLKGCKAIVAHTSGSVAMNVLKQHKKHGVLYPVQTLSKKRNVSLKHVPFCIEASDKPASRLLSDVASSITDRIYYLDSAQRQKLHLAAVIANNFSNHLFALADAFLIENDLSFDLLRPLITETAAKLAKGSPVDLQTGPARRGDTKTMQQHLALLDGKPQMKKLYKLFSQSIAKKYR